MNAVFGPGSQRAVIWWHRLAVMTRKEMLQLFRDVPIVAFLVYSFTLAILCLSACFSRPQWVVSWDA